MAYEIFLNVPKRPRPEQVAGALEQLHDLPELEVCELHELEDVGRSPEEYAEDLEWLLEVEDCFEDRYREFCQRQGLNAALDPLDPAAASRFMEELGGFDFAVARFPMGDELADWDDGVEGAGVKAVTRAWKALVAFARKNGLRLMDPQFNDPGEFVDLASPGELPPAYE